MPNVQVTKTLTLANLMAFKVVSAPPTMGLQTDDVDVSDLSNANRMEKAPRSQKEEMEVAIQCEFDGTLADVGESGTLEITVTKNDGTTLVSTMTGYVKSAVPIAQDIGGERRLLQDVVFVPDGANSTTTTTTA